MSIADIKPFIPIGAQPYEVITPAASDPIALSDLKAWLKITNNASDSVLTSIIKGVTGVAEKYMKIDLIKKTYRTYRDQFGDVGGSPAMRPICPSVDLPITLRRAPLDSVVKIDYLSDNVSTEWPSNEYRIIRKSAFSQVRPAAGFNYPEPDRDAQVVTIDFIAGIAADENGIPEDLKTALKEHATHIFYNRGDCDDGSGECDCSDIPGIAKTTYNQYRILDFIKP